MEMEQQHLRNGNGRNKHQFVPCISKDLYDEPPQSDLILLQMFYNILHKTFIILSKFCLGQKLISILDYYMIKIENTLDFCLPENSEFAAQRIIDKHKRTLPIQDRPMSWLFFIPALIFLRIVRFTLSFYCILSGMGEVTAQLMQSKVIAFRRYYRSIRHYAVNKWSEEHQKLIISRKKWLLWRLYYRVYELIFMTRPIVEIHHQNCLNGDKPEKKSNGRQKRSLELSTSDDDLNANEMLEKYANIEDSLTVDPDYEPDEAKALNETVELLDYSDNEEAVEEAFKKLANETAGKSFNAMDIANDEQAEDDTKSNKDYSLTPSQMNELESEITLKILNYFRENYSFSPNDHKLSGEVFYSPIDSPPENGCELNGIAATEEKDRIKVQADDNNVSW